MDTTIAVIAKNDGNKPVANIQQMIFKSKIRNYWKCEVKNQKDRSDLNDYRVELIGYVYNCDYNSEIVNRGLLKIPGHADIELEHIYTKALIPS